MYIHKWKWPSTCSLLTEVVNLALTQAWSLFPVPKLYMPRLSSAGNCYLLLSNTVTGMVPTRLDINKGERQALKQHLAMLPNSPPLLQTGQQKGEWALSLPFRAVISSEGETEERGIHFHWHLLQQTDQYQLCSGPRKFRPKTLTHTWVPGLHLCINRLRIPPVCYSDPYSFFTSFCAIIFHYRIIKSDFTKSRWHKI